uniref:OSJNBa0019J05.4 protein n=1 Tax=Oryza sativa subsp. japonica TaxID=39947 RepID=Q7X6R8_ORYSJ|nr:OSJNBa0071G03.15 [Oryza sativa Japonica Group]CAD40206.2 OSJNBa0019J05.4 [Oryza sativa Japonica Group]
MGIRKPRGKSAKKLKEFAGLCFTVIMLQGSVICMLSKLLYQNFILSACQHCMYGPCNGPERPDFVGWLKNIQIDAQQNWLFLGDFNFYRSTYDRNKVGADMNDIFIFNEIISSLGLLEIPLKGRRFTWSNMQQNPLLERLDWVFTSASWTLTFPNTTVIPLTRNISDHVPCVVKIDTKIPKSPIFRFENFWVEAEGFFDVVQQVWLLDPGFDDPAKCISFKLKIMRKKLKLWSKNLSRIMLLLNNCNKVIDFLALLEEDRSLSLFEWNFREVVKHQILKLLEYKKIYWKKRCTNRWMLLGEEHTKFFQSIATERYRMNIVSQVSNQSGQIVYLHDQKANLFYHSFKNRMGISCSPTMDFNLTELFVPRTDLECLIDMFYTQEIDNLISIIPADKARGPDGFNGFFMKKCWHIIAQDFYRLVAHFHAESTDLQQSKREIIILKLDFEKAFDTIEHTAILSVMQSMGFPQKWLNWVQMVFSSASTAVLLNGVPGNSFTCKRGVRQGDPLSPLIYVLGAELLQRIVNRAFNLGLISKPINANDGSGFPIIQYADDTLILLKTSQKEIFCFKALLNMFALSTGLKVNYAKSSLYPLNLSEEKTDLIAGLLRCSVGKLPFTYLGLPLGTTRPRVIDFAPPGG